MTICCNVKEGYLVLFNVVQDMGTQDKWHEAPYTFGPTLKLFGQVLLWFWSLFPGQSWKSGNWAFNQRAKFWKSDYSHLGWPSKGSNVYIMFLRQI